jgi:hypothetical protein
LLSQRKLAWRILSSIRPCKGVSCLEDLAEAAGACLFLLCPTCNETSTRVQHCKMNMHYKNTKRKSLFNERSTRVQEQKLVVMQPCDGFIQLWMI